MFEWIKNVISKKEVQLPEVKIIETTKGKLSETLLEKREGVVDNTRESTTWTEYWFDGELVHRSVHVTLKPQVVAQSIIGDF